MRVLKKVYLSQKPRPESKAIAALTIALVWFFSWVRWEAVFEFAPLMEASGKLVFEKGEWWRLLTTMFVHADAKHMLGNSIPLLVLSYLIFGYYGYGVHPFFMLFLGSVTNFLSLKTYPPETYLVGISGMVYAMAAFWLVLYFFIERRLSVGRRLLNVLGVFMITLVPTSFIEPRVSHRTHAIGFGIGILAAAVYYLHKRKWFLSQEVYEGTPDEPQIEEEEPIVWH